MTTIRDVARRAGVSTTTVSHVINRTRKVDAITAARVEAAIGELGYRPNALARSMRRGRTHTVGVILPDIANPFFGDLARWLEDALFEAGYSAIICNSDGDERKETRYLDVLLSKKVDGLLLIAASQPSEQLRHLVDTGPPTIVVDRELDDLPVSQVMVANQHGGYLAGRHLARAGPPRHRASSPARAAWARQPSGWTASGAPSPTPASPSTGTLSSAVTSAPPAAGRPWRRCWPCDPAPARSSRRTTSWPSGPSARRTLPASRSPADLSVVGFDGIAFGADVTPPLTTVVQSTSAIAATAVELLLDQLADGRVHPRQVELPVALEVRGSCAPPPPGA